MLLLGKRLPGGNLPVSYFPTLRVGNLWLAFIGVDTPEKSDILTQEARDFFT